MSKQAKQWYFLERHEVLRFAGRSTYPGIDDAIRRMEEIERNGHKAAVYWSEFNAFRVIDEDDPEQFKIGLGISSKAKRFPS